MSVAGMRARHLSGGIRAGVLATLTMDGAMLAAGFLGGDAWASDRLGPGVIGRWAAGLMRGRWRHDDIRAEPARHGELALGILTHYVTGIILTEAFLLPQRHGSGRPSLLGAVGFGVATSGLPLLLLYPSLRYGPFGLRTGDAARLDRIMLLGHVAFGVGIALWSPRPVEGAPRRGRARWRAPGGADAAGRLGQAGAAPVPTGHGEAAGEPAA